MSADDVLNMLRQGPYNATVENTMWYRLAGARAVLTWLAGFPGISWQERWLASPAAECPRRWSEQGHLWVAAATEVKRRGTVQSGLLVLAGADVIRLPLQWLVGHRSAQLRGFVEEARDPAGFTLLKNGVGQQQWKTRSGSKARLALTRILLAKGGTIADIAVGDALEYDAALRQAGASSTGGASTLYYAWLRELGGLPGDAPTTLRLLGRVTGQLTCEQLVDRHGVASGPIRGLLIDYLEERRHRLDFGTLDNLARSLTRNFWSDLERHHPGIASLDLAPDVAAAWKERMRTRVKRCRRPDGTLEVQVVERADRALQMMAVRAFYLDIARWALEEPARWGPWAAPCPIKEAEVQDGKRAKRVKARMDQRTRERLPALETFAQAAADHHRHLTTCLETLRAVPPGTQFTVGGSVFVRSKNGGDCARDMAGTRVHLDLAEHRAFWAWAAVEFLRHTGARIEEMLEISHHCLVQYRLPTTGEIVPLLQIAPSKTDQERVLLVSPELSDVLSTIIRRVRDPRSGAIPLVAAYDYEERVWSPPAPLLFQWDRAGERSRMSGELIRRSLGEVLAFIGLTDATGQPLDFAPHDFRRMFVTDAIRSGLPPHIAQAIVGHSNINTTMGYNAVYPTETIEAHRAFTTRRRALRPAEEYRTPTDSEWEDFLGHFERRKLSVGTCARAYGTACIHEHACVRCSLLRPDPAQHSRLVEIRDNLVSRIVEAENQGWLGEVEGLQVSLAGAENKIRQLESSPRGPTLLGIPAVPARTPCPSDL
ncbi:site-specific integrase [Streptomyces sp. NBC_00264]|uniref:tyrosine-type recombinase/integrase n=1 Tax=unclassified Streptomyces TaxID=2593676 RepID=UPI002256AF3C|nr:MULTISPECIES: site-specific integrase [unclassified Streptomyces]MCX5166284.1 site-specific integrase [Streptomyces sp. NBC_00305]MCX5224801.1 site-specific integrase [Streptomyces sp. NBC_00264]